MINDTVKMFNFYCVVVCEGGSLNVSITHSATMTVPYGKKILQPAIVFLFIMLPFGFMPF